MHTVIRSYRVAFHPWIGARSPGFAQPRIPFGPNCHSRKANGTMFGCQPGLSRKVSSRSSHGPAEFRRNALRLLSMGKSGDSAALRHTHSKTPRAPDAGEGRTNA